MKQLASYYMQANIGTLTRNTLTVKKLLTHCG